MRAARLDRLRRGSIAATGATFVALLSHVSAGAAMPGPLGLIAPWILALAVCTVLVGRSWGPIRMTAAVLVSQAIFHVLFVLGTVTPSGVAQPEHQHGLMLMPMPAAAPSGASTALVPDAAMLLGHGVAAAATVLFLRHGERTVLALARLVTSAFARLAVVFRASLPTVTPTVPRPRALVVQIRPTHADPSISPRSLRGPPLPVVA